MSEGFNIIYAKKGGRPKNTFLESRRDVVEFFLENLNDIDMLSVNDVIIDTEQLIKGNVKLMRYLKLRKIIESI
jgi:hypothetical protein